MVLSFITFVRVCKLIKRVVCHDKRYKENYFCPKFLNMILKPLQDKVANSRAIVLYFKNDACAPCLALRPKVQELIETDFPKMEFEMVDTTKEPLLSSAYHVFSNPTILVFFEGKEYIRKSKNIGIGVLGQEIERLYKMVF